MDELDELDELDERGVNLRYRLLLILENAPSGRNYTAWLDGNRVYKIDTDDPIVAINTSPGDHRIKIMEERWLEETATFRIPRNQPVTRVHIIRSPQKIILRIDAGRRTRKQQPQENLPEPSPKAQPEIQPETQPETWSSQSAPVIIHQGMPVWGAIVVFVVGLVAGFFLRGILLPQQSTPSAPVPVAEVTATVPPGSSTPIPTANTAATPAAHVSIGTVTRGGGALAGCPVEVVGARGAVDQNGNRMIIITFAWTNGTDANASASSLFRAQASQNGIRLATADSANPSFSYDNLSIVRDIRPGASLEVECAFALENETAQVEFALSERSDNTSGAVVRAVFDPAGAEE